MLPLPEHLQLALQELERYYQSLQADYELKLKAAKQQLGNLEALRMGALAPPPELAVHLQELEKYYSRLSCEISQSGILAATQRDRVKAILDSSKISESPGTPAPTQAVEYESVQAAPTLPIEDYPVSPGGEPEAKDCQQSPVVEPGEIESEAVFPSIPQTVDSSSVQAAIPQAIDSELVQPAIPQPIDSELVQPAIPQPIDSESGQAAIPQTVDSESGQAAIPQTVDSESVAPVVEPSELARADVGVSAVPDGTELLNNFLHQLHPATRSPLNLCRAKGKLYIEERSSVTILVISPNEYSLEQRIRSRLKIYQERFSTFIGKPASVELKESFPFVPLLIEYEGMTLEQAIAKLLADNRGIILQRDYIVRSLYGLVPKNVKPNIYRKVSQSLKAGVKSGLWDVDPDNNNCYIFNYEELVESELARADLSCYKGSRKSELTSGFNI